MTRSKAKSKLKQSRLEKLLEPIVKDVLKSSAESRHDRVLAFINAVEDNHGNIRDDLFNTARNIQRNKSWFGEEAELLKAFAEKPVKEHKSKIVIKLNAKRSIFHGAVQLCNKMINNYNNPSPSPQESDTASEVAIVNETISLSKPQQAIISRELSVLIVRTIDEFLNRNSDLLTTARLQQHVTRHVHSPIDPTRSWPEQEGLDTYDVICLVRDNMNLLIPRMSQSLMPMSTVMEKLAAVRHYMTGHPLYNTTARHFEDISDFVFQQAFGAIHLLQIGFVGTVELHEDILLVELEFVRMRKMAKNQKDTTTINGQERSDDEERAVEYEDATETQREDDTAIAVKKRSREEFEVDLDQPQPKSIRPST